jgi:Flagellin and related hook-associated proteins
MDGPLALSFSAQAMANIRRITGELTDLQRQIASGAKHSDLQGFGAGAASLLTAQGLRATADSQNAVITQLQARFGVQGEALGRVSQSAGLLAQSIRDAISANDGRGIPIELEMSFTSTVSALNETWNGQPLFAGERQGAGPITINTLDELQGLGPGGIFDEALRHQTIDFGTGSPIVVSKMASELSQGLFDTMLQLKALLDSSGGTIGQPISAQQTQQLQAIAAQLDTEAAKFVTEQGRAGQLSSRFEAEQIRLTARSDLITKEIGEVADADVAMATVKLATLMTQYQATAKTFSELSQLSLLDYL